MQIGFDIAKRERGSVLVMRNEQHKPHQTSYVPFHRIICQHHCWNTSKSIMLKCKKCKTNFEVCPVPNTRYKRV